MGYRKNLMSKIVENIDHSIVVTDSKYTFEKKLDIIFEETMDMTNYYSFIVKNLNGREYLKCSYYQDNIVIYSINDEPICNLTNYCIYRGEEDKELITEIKEKDFSTIEKYTVGFKNLINQTIELLYLNCDLKYRCGGIFYGKEKLGSPLICRIIRNLYYTNCYKVEIASGIDITLIITLVCFFMKNSYKTNKGKYPEVPYRNFFNSICQKQVERPLNNIITMDSNYISEKPVIFNLVKNKKVLSDYFCTINGMDKTYVLKENLVKDVLLDASTDKPIFKTSGRKFWVDEDCVSSIHSMTSRCLNKYSVDILNKNTNKMEKFVMNCDPFFYYGYILYLNENGQVSLVCKITKDQYEKYDYQIEIAPGIDYMMMIAVCLHFVGESDKLIEIGVEESSKKISLSGVVSVVDHITKTFFKRK